MSNHAKINSELVNDKFMITLKNSQLHFVNARSLREGFQFFYVLWIEFKVKDLKINFFSIYGPQN